MAEIKISELTSGSTLDGTEVVPIVQSGATVKVTTQDIADLGGGGGGGGNRLATHILSKPQSSWYYSNATLYPSLNVVPLPTNMLYITAFTPAYDLTIDTLILQITTAYAGGLAKVVIYDDKEGVPHTKLFESVDVLTDTTGSKTITGISFTFTAGTTYWIGTISNNPYTAFRAIYWNSPVAPIIAASATTQIYTAWAIYIIYASLPTILPTPTAGNLTHNSVPYLVFRAV